MLTGQNGILNRSVEATLKQSNAKMNEVVGLKYSEYQMEEKLSPSGLNFMDYMQNNGYVSSDGSISTQSLLGNKLSLGSGSEKKDVYVLESTENGYIVNYYNKEGNKDAEIWSIFESTSSDISSDNNTKRDENMFEFDATTGTILRVKKDYLLDYYNTYSSTYFNKDDAWCKIKDEVDTLIIPNSINGIKVKNVQHLGITNVKNIIFEEGIEEIHCIANYSRWDSWEEYDTPQLISVKIPSSVTKMSNLFKECGELSSIIVDSNNPKYTSGENENVIIDKSTNELLVGCKNSVISNNVVSIGNYAFQDCVGLTNILIPNSVTNIGDYAFSNCTGLTSISIPNSVTNIGGHAFSNCKELSEINLSNKLEKIKQWTFKNCSKLKNVVINEGVTEIERYAFVDCKGLTSIIIPKSLSIINEEAFGNCTSVESILIPKNVTKIRGEVFYNWTSKQTIKFEVESEQSTWSYDWDSCSNANKIYGVSM